MRIYLASSWKNEQKVRHIKAVLRYGGHKVDAFCDDSEGRFTFNFSEIPNIEELDAQTVLNEEIVQKAFAEDKAWLDWSEVVVLILPAGKSAHLEAGYAKGQGKHLIIYQESFPLGELDVMYGFADLITSDMDRIIHFLRQQEQPEYS